MNQSLAAQFREIRRVSTPWCIVRTSDYRATVRSLMEVKLNGESPCDCVLWDCAEGPRNLRGDAPVIGSDTDPPSAVLRNARILPDNTILFFVVPDERSMPNDTWSNPFTVQAAANLRDEFKANRRTLVFLSTDGKLPPMLVDDVPILEDPLPDKEEIGKIIADYLDGENEQKKLGFVVSDIDKATELCRGMTRFACEDNVSRRFSRQRKGFDLNDLALAQRTVIEQSSGLKFEKGPETFEDIGGLDQIKTFAKRLFAGSRPPTVLVRIEEIEKAMAGSGSSFGDSSGVSQDQLGVLLSAMEDFNWTGLIAVGPPGSGKSLVSKAMGNTFKVPSINLDLGALKGSYVGQSEMAVRKAMKILRSFADDGAFFLATSNGLSVIPPELRRRFRFGVWYFDLPSAKERESIWAINLQRFSLQDAKRPNDADWTGSDIRNVCDLASRLKCSLSEASEYIVPVSKSDPQAIQKLRDSAAGKFLSASLPGPYQPTTKTSRAQAL